MTLVGRSTLFCANALATSVTIWHVTCSVHDVLRGQLGGCDVGDRFGYAIGAAKGVGSVRVNRHMGNP